MTFVILKKLDNMYWTVMLLYLLALSNKGDSQLCVQNFILPGFNIQEQQSSIDYDISACVRCNVNSFTILVAGSGLSPTPLTNSTNGVTIVPTSGGRYRLLMPIPRDVLSSTSATIIACDGESIRFIELVFGSPTLKPNGSIVILEGSNVSLSCASYDLIGLTITWTRGSTQLVSVPSANSLTHTITNIMINASGTYTCSLVYNIGTVPWKINREENVTINVQRPTSVILSTAPIVQKTLGSQLNLTCWFDGIPTPNITWLVNGSMLNSSLPHLSVSFEGNSVSLQFVTIKLTDIGIYSCRGYNGFGSIVFSNVTIIVQTKPEPVQILLSTAVTSTTITILWFLGFDGRESIDTVTVSYAASDNNASVSEGTISLAASAATAYTLQDLQPLTKYTITVIAINAIGSSPPSIIAGTTKPLPPFKPKIALGVTEEIQLALTAPTLDSYTQTPLLYYHVEYSSFSNFSDAVSVVVPSSNNTIIVERACFYRVSVNNSAGSSHAAVVNRPGAAIQNPGIATDSSSSSDMIVTVLPYRYQTSSIIQNFIVSLVQYNNMPEGTGEERVVYNNQTLLQTNFTSLSPFEPYYATVVAIICGERVSSYVINYTRQGLPPVPHNVSVYRLSGTRMFVSWDLIPLTVSRGFILNYTVVYHIHDMVESSTEVMVSGTHDNIVITGLDSSNQYIVSVSAITSAGQGNASSTYIVSLPVSTAGFTVTTTAAIIAVLVGIVLILVAAVIALLIKLISCSAHSVLKKSDPPIDMTTCAAYNRVQQSTQVTKRPMEAIYEQNDLL